MDLEIICRQSSSELQQTTALDNSSETQSQFSQQSSATTNSNNNNNNNNNSINNNGNINGNSKISLHLITAYISNKFKQLTHPPERHVNDDDWWIPFERMRIYHNDFQRCGAQGDVYYGKISNTPVAIKRVKDKSLTKIKHLINLNHKYVSKTYGVSRNASYFYIIMEWCPYGTLHDHIHSGKQLSSAILSNFTQQIACGMEYLHSKNIIHRDLKPTNILLTHNDVLKISDFGTHVLLTDETGQVKSNSYEGSAAYMAPEVIRSDPYSFPVDIWSYGVVVWEILTDVEPFKNLNSSAVIWAVGNNNFKLPIPSGFPEGYRKILDNCWEAQPNKRITFKQIRMYLKGAIPEVDKISKERWIPAQADWKREIKHELNKHLQSKQNQDDQSCNQKRQECQALNEAWEQIQRERLKNQDIFLRLQEISLHSQTESTRGKEELNRREELVNRREEEVNRRLEALDKEKERFSKKKEEEIEELKRQKEELDRQKEELAKEKERLLREIEDDREELKLQKEQLNKQKEEFYRLKKEPIRTQQSIDELDNKGNDFNDNDRNNVSKIDD